MDETIIGEERVNRWREVIIENHRKYLTEGFVCFEYVGSSQDDLLMRDRITIGLIGMRRENFHSAGEMTFLTHNLMPENNQWMASIGTAYKFSDVLDMENCIDWWGTEVFKKGLDFNREPTRVCASYNFCKIMEQGSNSGLYISNPTNLTAHLGRIRGGIAYTLQARQ